MLFRSLVTNKKFIIYTSGDEGDGGKDGEDNIYVNNDNNNENDNENNNEKVDEKVMMKTISKTIMNTMACMQY